MPTCNCHKDLLLLSHLTKEELKCEQKIIDHANNVLSSLALAEHCDHISPDLFKLVDAAQEFILKQLRTRKRLEAPLHDCKKLTKYKRQIRRSYSEYRERAAELSALSDNKSASEEDSLSQVEDGQVDEFELPAPEPTVTHEARESCQNTVADEPLLQSDEPQLVEASLKVDNNIKKLSTRIIRHKYSSNTEILLFIQHSGIPFPVKQNLNTVMAEHPQVMKDYLVEMKARGRNLLLARRPDLMGLFSN